MRFSFGSIVLACSHLLSPRRARQAARGAASVCKLFQSGLPAANNSFKPSPLRGLGGSATIKYRWYRSRAGLTQALAGARVGFSTLSSVTKPRIKGISCAVHFCQEQAPSSLARAACRPGQSATRIGSGCNRAKSDQRLVSQLTIRSSRRRFAASW